MTELQPFENLNFGSVQSIKCGGLASVHHIQTLGGGGKIVSFNFVFFLGGGILSHVLSPSNWCESNKKCCFTQFGGGHCHKSKVLVTGVKIICKKFSWQQLVQGGGRMPRLFFHFYFIFYYHFLFLFFWVGQFYANDEVTLK